MDTMEAPVNYQEKIDAGMSYEDYRDMINRLMAENKTTGTNHSEDYLHYTRLNVSRMDRHDKKVEITPELEAAVKAISKKTTWLVLTEAWCGDAAHNLPVIAKAAALSDKVDLKLVLRDEHMDLMNQHLTNGGMSIPKLVAIDDATGEVISEWGPRPAPNQKMVREYVAIPKEERPPYSEFVVEVQKWYMRDKSQTVQQELTSMLEG